MANSINGYWNGLPQRVSPDEERIRRQVEEMKRQYTSPQLDSGGGGIVCLPNNTGTISLGYVVGSQVVEEAARPVPDKRLLLCG